MGILDENIKNKALNFSPLVQAGLFGVAGGKNVSFSELAGQWDIILGNISDGITVQDAGGKLIYANSAAARQGGFNSAEEMANTSLEELKGKYEMFDEAGKPFSFEELPGRSALAGRAAADVRLNYKFKNGGLERWASVRAIPIKNSDGQVVFAVNIFRDITAEKQHEKDLGQTAVRLEQSVKKEHDQTVLLETLLTTAPVGFAFISPELEYLKINSELARMLAVDPKNYIGRKMGQIAPGVTAILEGLIKKVLGTKQTIINEEVSGELLTGPGKTYHWLISFSPVFGQSGELLGVGMVVEDITRIKKAEGELSYYASHDVLTSLLNRKTFEERLAGAMLKARSTDGGLAVMFLDLDRFKNINDTLGHSLGDQIMIEVANRLNKTLRDGDLVARWGGDEFVVLVGHAKEKFEVVRVAERIMQALAPAIRIENHTLHIAASIGISLFPQDGTNLHSLLKNADIALYRAKQAGRNRYQLYDEALNFKASELALESHLRLALERGEFKIFYQPIVNLKSMRVLGVEALIRWQHSELGLLKPNQFIHLAEEIGLIVPIGKWVLEQACLQNMKWHNSGFDHLSMSVNLSTKQFLEENVVETVKGALDSTGLPARMLELEITESVAMENIDRTKNKLTELNRMGVKIVIDDFGTGYSSLSYLKSFPVSKVKIDKSFVKSSVTEPQDSKIIRAIISMAESLNLKVIAEGVTTPTQLGMLAALGCHAAQGHLISRALSAEDLTLWLERQYRHRVKLT